MVGPVRVILNPASAGGATRLLRSEVPRELRLRRIEFEVAETEDRGHAVELARSAAKDGVRAVVAVGGDGTVHEVANGLLSGFEPGAGKTSPALAVIPSGTGNDFVKMLGTARNRRAAYDTVADGRIRSFDVGWAGWGRGSVEPRGEFFVNAVGTGIDVEVLRQMRGTAHLPGVLGYFRGLLGALARFEPLALRVRIDGELVETRVMLFSVANGPCQGGGFYLCPDASPEDGRFNTCMVKELGWLQIARMVPRVLRGTHGRSASVSMVEARRIELEAVADAPLLFQLDGELRELHARGRLVVELRPAELPVLAPAAGTR